MKSVAMATQQGIKQQTFSHVTWEPVGNRDVREVELCSERHPGLSVLCTLRVNAVSFPDYSTKTRIGMGGARNHGLVATPPFLRFGVCE